MDCCNNFLGNYPHNADIDSGIVVPSSGTFKFKFKYLGAIIEKLITVIFDEYIDQNFIIPNDLNANFLYEFTIEKPDGSLLSVNSCTDFSLKTYINITDCDSTCDAESDSVYLGY